MSDRSDLPVGSTTLRWKTLADKQRFDAIIYQIQAKFWLEGGARITREEAVLAGLNESTSRSAHVR